MARTVYTIGALIVLLSSMADAAWIDSWYVGWTNDTVWDSFMFARDIDNATRERIYVSGITPSNTLETLSVWPTWLWLGQIDATLFQMTPSFCDNRSLVYTNGSYNTWFSTHAASNSFPNWRWTNLCYMAFGATNFTHSAYWPSRTNLFTQWPRTADLAERKAVLELLVFTEKNPLTDGAVTRTGKLTTDYITNTYTLAKAGAQAKTPSTGAFYTYGWASEVTEIWYNATKSAGTRCGARWWRQHTRFTAGKAGLYLPTNHAAQADWYIGIVSNNFVNSNKVVVVDKGVPDNYNGFNGSNSSWYVLNVCHWYGDDKALTNAAMGYLMQYTNTTKAAASNTVWAYYGNTDTSAPTDWVADPPPGYDGTSGGIEIDMAKGYNVGSEDPEHPVLVPTIPTGDPHYPNIPPVLLRWDVTNGLRYVKQ